MLQNFCYHLDHLDLLRHALIFTTDVETWKTLHALEMPVYLDRAYTFHDQFGDALSMPGTTNRVFDLEKHWWGLQMVTLDFKTLYLDADAVVIKDPFAAFRAPEWDVQGLSDWNSAADTPDGNEIMRGCSVYKWVRDPLAPSGTLLRKSHGADPNTKLEPINIPCQSTGLWYLQPRPNVVEFMSAMVHRGVAAETMHEWEQASWNVVIMPFLIGSGDRDLPPLRYRLLPHAEYANADVVKIRESVGKSVDDLKIVHLGGVHGKNKAKRYKEMGLWRVGEPRIHSVMYPGKPYLEYSRLLVFAVGGAAVASAGLAWIRHTRKRGASARIVSVAPTA